MPAESRPERAGRHHRLPPAPAQATGRSLPPTQHGTPPSSACFQARERNEPLVIFGDYDVDGVTSTALLLEVLRALGWTGPITTCPIAWTKATASARTAWRIACAKFPATLLLAVDCGSTAVASIAWLRQRGVDVIVLDHHQVCLPAPAATALVNPQLGCPALGPCTQAPSTCNPCNPANSCNSPRPSPNSAPPAWPSSSPTPCSSADARPACPAQPTSTCARCWTWSRWAPSPTSSRSPAKTASWFPPAWNASTPPSAPAWSP